MLARSRKNLSTLRERSARTRDRASLKRGRSLATHLLMAGIDAETAKGMVIPLRGIAKRTDMQPVKVARTRNTVSGKGGRKARLRTVNHYTTAQVQTLTSVYKPRKAEYVAAKRVLVNA
jgi:hypothetical protein